jgi:hypothetical protein
MKNTEESTQLAEIIKMFLELSNEKKAIEKEEKRRMGKKMTQGNN